MGPTPGNLVNDLIVIVTQDLKDIASRYLLPAAGTICVMIIIWGGIQYITGGSKGEETAKKTIIAAIIGLIIVVLSKVIIDLVIQGVNPVDIPGALKGFPTTWKTFYKMSICL